MRDRKDEHMHETTIEAVVYTSDGVRMHVADGGAGEPCSVEIVHAPRGFESCVGETIQVCMNTLTVFVRGRPWAERVGAGRFRLIDPPAKPKKRREGRIDA